MKLGGVAGGGLAIALGLGVLWLAVTGRLDRIPEAWRVIVDGVKGVAFKGGTPGVKTPTAAEPLPGIPWPFPSQS